MYKNVVDTNKNNNSENKKIIRSKNEFDLYKFKAKIMEEAFIGSEEPEVTTSQHNIYENNQKKYIKEGITSSILNFVIRMTRINTFFTKDIKNENKVSIEVFEVVKTLFLNEVEITYWSMYLERITWDKQWCTLEEFLLISALAAKTCLNHEDIYDVINIHIRRKKPHVINKFKEWIKNKTELFNLAPRDFNCHFISLSKTANPYCKTNILDYNFLVDKILQLSQSYSETKLSKNENNDDESQGFKKEEETVTPNNLSSPNNLDNSQEEKENSYEKPNRKQKTIDVIKPTKVNNFRCTKNAIKNTNFVKYKKQGSNFINISDEGSGVFLPNKTITTTASDGSFFIVDPVTKAVLGKVMTGDQIHCNSFKPMPNIPENINFNNANNTPNTSTINFSNLAMFKSISNNKDNNNSLNNINNISANLTGQGLLRMANTINPINQIFPNNTIIINSNSTSANSAKIVPTEKSKNDNNNSIKKEEIDNINNTSVLSFDKGNYEDGQNIDEYNLETNEGDKEDNNSGSNFMLGKKKERD